MKKNNNKKIIIVISVIILILIIILAILNKTVKNQKQKQELADTVKSYTSISEFKTVEEVAIYLECEFIKMSDSKDKNYNTDIYIKIKYEPYINDQSNEGFYKRLILYCAEVLNYKSFRIIDSSKKITIEVPCNNEDKKIKDIIINGESNYFSKRDSLLEINNLETKKETDFNVKSKILQDIIENKWSSYYEFGTKESEYEQYNIYFDEGIEVRNINNKVYNLIFTSNYKEDIVNNIKATSSKNEIIKSLGEPTYSNEQYGIIGYKGKDFYLFYNTRQEISIYRIDKDYDSTEFIKIVEEYIENKDLEKLIQDTKNTYKDFDKYCNNSSGITLRYALKGIEIEYKQSLNNGIIIYNNYTEKVYKDYYLEDLVDELPNNISIKNENLVFNAETERLENINLEEYNAGIDKLNKTNKSESEKFYTVKNELGNNTYKLKFISTDKTNPNCELRENVNNYFWIDDYNLIYSVINKGLYVFSLKTRKYGTLVTGNEKFEIKDFKDNILTYDDKSLKLKN